MPHAKILVVDDEPDIRELVSEILADEGYLVQSAANGASARAAYANERPDLVLLDIWMPDIDGISLLKEWSADGELACPVVMISGHGTLETAVEATRLGAHDFVQKPLSLAKLLATVRNALEAGRKTFPSRHKTASDFAFEALGGSAQMQILRQKAEHAARHDSPILISGEEGSGRELLARYIHGLSGRDGEFISLDHTRMIGEGMRTYLLGADGDDRQSPGILGSASSGTLYIGDVQNLSQEAQELLFNALESNGKAQTQGARLIASVPEEPEALLRNGDVLERLYYLLSVLPLHIPPLRSRPEDVPEIVRYYAEWFPNHEQLPYRSFPISALNRLRNHSWPGNLRELQNLVQQLLILGGEGDVTVQEVEEALRQSAKSGGAASSARPGAFDLPLREAREQFEREYLTYQLQKAGGSVGKLAESVGMERTHLYRKLRTLGIDPKSVARKGDSN